MNKEQAKKGVIERGAGFFEKLHYAIGAVALIGAEVVKSSALAVFGVYEIVHGALWTFIKNRAAQKPKLA